MPLHVDVTPLVSLPMRLTCIRISRAHPHRTERAQKNLEKKIKIEMTRTLYVIGHIARWFSKNEMPPALILFLLKILLLLF